MFVTFTSKIAALTEMYFRLLISVTDVGKDKMLRYNKFTFFQLQTQLIV